jgi:hypothetical protein
MSLDLDTGLYYCHSCQEGGDVYKFYMKQNNCSFSKAKNAINGNEKTPILTETEVDVAHSQLLQSETIQNMLFIKRGWTLDTIKQFKLGWYDERVTIPIYDDNNTLANIRKYDVLHRTGEKFRGIQGHNQIRLYPIRNIGNSPIVLFAGEPDAILAAQLGLPAITFTSGEGTFKEQLLEFFKDKIVYICYDVDEKGIKSASSLSEHMCKYAKETRIINLPRKELQPKGDFTDLFFWCIEKKQSFVDVWNKLVADSVLVEETQKEAVEYEEVDFYNSVNEVYFDKPISFQAVAIGKNLTPYFAPKKITLSCDFSRGESCKECKLFLTGGNYVIEIQDNDLLDLVKCSQTEQKNKIKTLCGISKCNQFTSEYEMKTIEEVFISPVIDTEQVDRQFLIRKCFTQGHNIQLNKTYKFFGRSICDAKTQEATHLFSEQKPEMTALDKFKLTEEDIFALKIFQPEIPGFDGVVYKTAEIARDLAYNVPELIIGRDNLIIAYDLIFHSVLKFKFLGSTVEKGWTEILVLGDTRTGKTKTVMKLCKHYKVGEYITLESATLPGLVGGMSTVGRDVTFSWGILPINDGRLVILDEVNGLDTREISNLSSIRDSGIAERTVVGSTRKTSSRVRLIWISNPRSSNARISYYSSGVEAIKELLGRAEDIARLDIAIIVAKEDVEVEQMNRIKYNKPDHRYTSDLCNKLVMWAWSRKEKDVHFTEEAEKAILHYAVEMSAKYSDAIPLVQGSIQRIKLAKLSVALACRLFSSEDGIKVTVKKEHVEFVVNFLYEIYDSQFFGYRDYSSNRKQEDVISSGNEVEKRIDSMIEPEKFVAKMLATNMLSNEDLSDFTGWDRENLKGFRQLLVTNNCLKRRRNFLVKTPEFIKLLKSMDKKLRDK